jgi:hypothetical protein
MMDEEGKPARIVVTATKRRGSGKGRLQGKASGVDTDV